MKIKTDENTNDLKDILFDLLADEVESFTVSFDGSGDSGQIEDISLDEKILKKKVDGVKVANGTMYSVNGPETMWDNAETIRDVVEGVCYQVLTDACSGWEINDGSYGEFNFDVKNRKVSLDFNERITDVRSSTYTF